MKLRKLECKDAPFMLEWMHDQSVTEYLQADFATKTIEDCRQFIQDSRLDVQNLHMAIVDNADIYMGTVSLKHIENGRAEFAIAIRTCAMGKGFSQYGMSEIIRIGFHDLHLYSIYWCVNPLNQRAVKFYDKNGYERIDTGEIGQRWFEKIYSRKQITAFYWYQKKADRCLKGDY